MGFFSKLFGKSEKAPAFDGNKLYALNIFIAICVHCAHKAATDESYLQHSHFLPKM